MRDTVTIVAGSPVGEIYGRQISARLTELGVRTWSLDDVEIGESRIEAINTAVNNSIMLVLVITPDFNHDHWAMIQTYAYQAQTHLNSSLKIVVVPLGLVVLEPTLVAQSVVLSSDLEPGIAADLCAAMLYSSRALSSFQVFPPADNHNAPVLYASAWPVQPDLSLSSYETYVETITSLIRLNEYEIAEALYWKILYYSGYRGLWSRRLHLSEALLQLSIESHDAASSGNILTVGIAYTFLTLGEFDKAQQLLRDAFTFTKLAKDRRGEGRVWGYMADIYAQTGRLNQAILTYDQAADALQGIERRRMQLKGLFLLARNEDGSPREQVARLTSLRNEFASIYDYHAPLTDIEIAKRLYATGDHAEALVLARGAAHMLRNVIKMPRNAALAEQLLQTLEEKQEEES